LSIGQLQELLASAGAVVIDGPKACGKTETARQHAASEILLDTDPAAATAIAIDPNILLEGLAPRLLAERPTRSSMPDRPGVPSRSARR
jgi:uncharacterized protein